MGAGLELQIIRNIVYLVSEEDPRIQAWCYTVVIYPPIQHHPPGHHVGKIEGYPIFLINDLLTPSICIHYSADEPISFEREPSSNHARLRVGKSTYHLESYPQAGGAEGALIERRCFADGADLKEHLISLGTVRGTA